MSGHLSAVVDFVYILSVFILTGFVYLFSLRIRKISREKQTTNILDKYRDYFTYLAIHFDDDTELGIPNGSLTRAEKRVIQDKICEWIEGIQGRGRAKLIDLCRTFGMVEMEISRLGSPSRHTRIHAAYRLGVMRCGESVPQLLNLLDTEKYRPSLFIIARSIAKSAQNLTDLRAMVVSLVQRRKGVHDLIVDILAETQLDCLPVFIEFLKEEDEDLQEIALVGLRGQTDSQVTEVLIRMIESEKKELRVKAVQTCLEQIGLLTTDLIASWMRHPDWEIRAETAKALGGTDNPFFMELLKEALNDHNWWVRYNSAKSLAILEEAGFKTLCETAATGEDSPAADMALGVIHEEMQKGIPVGDNLAHALNYNRQVYIYRQFFKYHDPAAKRESHSRISS